MDSMPFLLLPELFTDADGRAKFRDVRVDLPGGNSAAALSPLQQGSGHQFHCTTTPQWLIVLSGAMEIGLQDGSSRVFQAGQCFFSNDTLPNEIAFDAKLHGHWSAQVGDEALVTVFVRV
jgi:hypothetical protein